MMSDRLENIKSTHERGTLVCQIDISWLISEVERLRAERNSAINEASRLHSRLTSIYDSLSKEMHRAALNSDDLGTLLTAVIHQRRGAMTELHEIHDILAEALGYQKAPTLEEDPNCPCPGAYVTGDHTAASLAAEAARGFKDRGESIASLGRSVDRVVSRNAALERELAKVYRHQVIFDEMHLYGVATEGKGAKKAELRREIEALRRVCRCSYSHEDDMLLFDTECPTHGTEACNTRLAGEKALNTLAYVRKYFMGSEHGHEV
jgi:hypothetical protein